MALTGTFKADFSEFVNAVTNAEKHLTNFAAGADRAGARLNAMQDSFSGKKIIQDATLMTAAVERAGGASVLTAKEMARVNATVTEAIAKYAALGQQAPPAMTALAEATKRVEAPTEGLSTKMVALGSFIGTMAANAVAALGRLAMQGLSAVASSIGELVMNGAKLSGIDNSFQTLARSMGEVGAVMLGAMRTGTRGLVSDMDLMQAANKAILLGLPVTSKEMGDLAQTAAVLGRAMGLTATQSFNDLITALGRSSPLILDNLGLSVKVGEANEGMARKLGKTVEALTDAEKKTAFYNAAMEAARVKVAELGESHLTLGDNIQKAGVWWENFKNDLAIAIARSPVLGAGMEALGSSLAAAFGTDSAGRVKTLTDLINKFAIWVVDAGIYLIEFGRVGVQVFNALAVPQKALAAAFVYLVERFAAGMAEMAELSARLPGVGNSFEGVARSARKTADTWGLFRTSASGALDASLDLARGQGAVHDGFDKVSGVLVKVRAAMVAAGNTIAQTTTTQARATAATVTDTTETEAQTRARLESEKAAAKFAATVKNLYTSDLYEPFKRGVQEASQALEELPANAKIAENGLTLFKAAVIATGTATDSLGTKIREGLSGVLASIPGTLARAFEGGGNWLGAVQSLGSQIGSTLGKTIGSSVAMLGSLGGPIGSAIGSLAGPLIGKIAGLFTDKNKQQVQQYNAEIEKLRAGLLTTYGTMQNLELAANAVGLSFEENWGHQGEAGMKAFQALSTDFHARIDGMKTKLGELKSELETLLSKAAGLGYNFNAAGELVSVSFEKMQEKAKTYGVSLDSLGPTFQKQRLHEMAGTIINDFDLLTRGGADVGTVLFGMKDEISKLVVDSKKFGYEIPANMQPWIKELMRTHQLTDENGVAMTDLGALKFAAPIETEFEKISKKIGELIDAIQTMVDKITLTLAPAIESVTRNRTINIGWNVEDRPDLGSGVAWGGAQARGGDYFVTKPTLFLAGEAGPERATFGGANQDGGSSDEMRRLIMDLPRAITLAFADALVLQGARR